MGVAQWATIIFFSPMKQLEGSEHFIVLYYFLTFFFFNMWSILGIYHVFVSVCAYIQHMYTHIYAILCLPDPLW